MKTERNCSRQVHLLYDAFRDRVKSDASRTTDRSSDTSDRESTGSDFRRPDNRPVKRNKRSSRIIAITKKDQGRGMASTSDDSNADRATSQYKRKRVTSPIREVSQKTKPCDCGGTTADHRIFYENIDGELKRHACMGSKDVTQKHIGRKLYTKNEYNELRKQNMTFESEYMKETDKKDKKTCDCGDDTGSMHFLHDAAPLIPKRQLEEQHQRNKNHEMITSVQQPDKELVVVISDIDMDIERNFPKMSGEDKKLIEKTEIKNAEIARRKAKKEEKMKERETKERLMGKLKTDINSEEISNKDQQEAGPSNNTARQIQKLNSDQSTEATETRQITLKKGKNLNQRGKNLIRK
ncbi:hypothetical protein JTB14_012504 [Gonioctena quinquepunctata]|nr:hypothetical protein JTB14_012504 [Gonioctena quinquepunctata]